MHSGREEEDLLLGEVARPLRILRQQRRREPRLEPPRWRMLRSLRHPLLTADGDQIDPPTLDRARQQLAVVVDARRLLNRQLRGCARDGRVRKIGVRSCPPLATPLALAAVDCAGESTLTSPGRFGIGGLEIIDEGESSIGYDDNENYCWRISPASASSTTALTLVFDLFQTETNHDFVTVYDASTEDDANPTILFRQSGACPTPRARAPRTTSGRHLDR